MDGIDEFKKTCMEYYWALRQLTKDILQVLALTLELEESYFEEYTSGMIANIRMLHYPPQQKDSDEKVTRGSGGDTGVGGITVLLQGDVGGLQVWDAEVKEWFDVRHHAASLHIFTLTQTGHLPGNARPRRLRRQPRQPNATLDQRPLQIQPPPRHQQIRQGTLLDPVLQQRKPGLRD